MQVGHGQIGRAGLQGLHRAAVADDPGRDAELQSVQLGYQVLRAAGRQRTRLGRHDEPTAAQQSRQVDGEGLSAPPAAVSGAPVKTVRDRVLIATSTGQRPGSGDGTPSSGASRLGPSAEPLRPTVPSAAPDAHLAPASSLAAWSICCCADMPSRGSIPRTTWTIHGW